MKNLKLRGALWAAFAVALSGGVSVEAQSLPAGAQQSSPAPDLSGVWAVSNFKQELAQMAPELNPKVPPFLPAAAAKYAKMNHNDSPSAHCLPPGVPFLMTMPYPFEIIQVPGRVLTIHEFGNFVRRIHTDGRNHPADPDPTWLGDSVGKWDGGTLVVDSVGFNDKSWMDLTGLTHSEALHLTERFRLIDRNTLSDDITIDDPMTFTKAWTVHVTYSRKPDWEIQEFVCAENNLFLTNGQPPDPRSLVPKR